MRTYADVCGRMRTYAGAADLGAAAARRAQHFSALDGASADICVLLRRLHALGAVSLRVCVSVPALLQLLQLLRSSVAAADVSVLVRRLRAVRAVSLRLCRESGECVSVPAVLQLLQLWRSSVAALEELCCSSFAAYTLYGRCLCKYVVAYMCMLSHAVRSLLSLLALLVQKYRY